MISQGFVTQFATPCLVFVLMLCVGFELTWNDFRRLAGNPRPLVIGTAVQAIAPPVIAFFTILAVDPPADIAAAIAILSLCPSGSLSNAYCYFARINLGLSVSLTVVSSLVSIVSFPLLGALLLGFLDMVAARRLETPILDLMAQILLFAGLPLVCGMALRARLGARGTRLQRLLPLFGSVLLLAVIALAILATPTGLDEILRRSWLPASLFTIATFALAFLCAGPSAPAEAGTVAIEASVRNIPIALLLSSQMIAGSKFDYFLGYLLVQACVLLPLAAGARIFRASRPPADTAEADGPPAPPCRLR